MHYLILEFNFMESGKIAVILLGPPGSGKTTQAQKVADEFGLVHFNTGEVIKDTISDPNNQNDPVILKEKQLYESGALNTDTWVTEIVLKEIKKISNSGKGIVFSGSPRRLLEAEGMLKTLDVLYGRNKIFAFSIPISFETALKRIKSRRICSVCGYPLMPDDTSENCPKCGGKIEVRLLDDPEKLKIRFNEYHKKTEPIFDYFRSVNLKINSVDGEKTPEEIHKDIVFIIKENL